jgi:hypothetical protein
MTTHAIDIMSFALIEKTTEDPRLGVNGAFLIFI